MKKALVIGATGSTGKYLVEELLKKEEILEVKIFVRREFPLKHPKLSVHIINFDEIESYKDLIVGDILFSALGTTLKQAKSKENQWKIDYDYQYNFAKIASEKGVKQYFLVSSAGADKNSVFFYQKMKGSLEDSVKRLSFDRICIFQPPILDRNTSERLFEFIGLKVIKGLNKIGLLRSYAPLPTKLLAQAMINVSFENFKGIFSYNPKQIRELLINNSKN